MGENYNTGTCTIRVGRDYVCLNFGSNLAASASVRDRRTRRTLVRSPQRWDQRVCGAVCPNGIDLAREVKMRWQILPVILTSGHSRERVGGLKHRAVLA